MTIQELKDNLSSLDEKPRKEVLSILIDDIFCNISRMDILKFQQRWDGRRPYEEFKEAFDQVIIGCIDIELSEIGNDVRKAFGLEPLTLETEIKNKN